MRAPSWIIAPYEPRCAPHIVALWWRSIGDLYPLREPVLRQCLEFNPLFRPGDALVAWHDDQAIGFAYVVMPRPSDMPWVESPLRAYLQAVVVDPGWRGRGLARSLVHSLLTAAARDGVRQVAAGGGTGYLWPGVPTDLDRAIGFMQDIGFQLEGTTYDLRGDVGELAGAPEAANRLTQLGLRLANAKVEDRLRITEFLVSQGWRHWAYETTLFFLQGGEPDDFLLLQHDDEIVAFARLHRPRPSGPVGPPLFWASRRGTRAGGLGPIGVARDWQRRGVGRALLTLGLDALRRDGLTDVVIDWTDLLDFYGPMGFRPWIVYRTGFADIAIALRRLAQPKRRR
jgi:GNAT superfamily N-acetyltransferase